MDAGKRVHFVSNVDGHELGHVLRQVRPESTLFLIASNPFTTAGTMLNAHSARRMVLRQGRLRPALGRGCRLLQHFVALTANVAAAQAFGITRCLGFRTGWGRFSLWSAIGLPIAIAIGQEQFRDLLAGAHAMDAHFSMPPLGTICRCAWRCWTFGTAILPPGSRCIAPYSHGLRPRRICSSWRWRATASASPTQASA